MAFPTIDRALDAFNDFVNGSPISFDPDQPPPETETAPKGLYNVGQIVRQYIKQWLGVEPNLATPANLKELLLTFDELTKQLERQVASNPEPSTLGRLASLGVMGAPLWMVFDASEQNAQRSMDAIRADLRRWRIRLDTYIAHTESAPDPNDRWYTLNEVTAPLFLGWFGGPDGTTVPLPPGGVPQSFDPTVQHIADLATPFQIANEMGVWLDWEARRWRQLVKDLEDGAKGAGEKASDGLTYLVAGLAVGGIGGALLGKKMS